VQQGALVYSAEWEPISSTGQIMLNGIVVGFWGLGGILAMSTAVVLFGSRARRELRGGRWGVRTVVVANLYGTAFGIVFVYLGLFESGQELGLSAHDARFNAIFLGLLGVHFLALSVASLLAAGLPYRRVVEGHLLEMRSCVTDTRSVND
jgi:ABC-type thiamin/hydroxymethylpyrimidine transport system permease subunit